MPPPSSPSACCAASAANAPARLCRVTNSGLPPRRLCRTRLLDLRNGGIKRHLEADVLRSSINRILASVQASPTRLDRFLQNQAQSVRPLADKSTGRQARRDPALDKAGNRWRDRRDGCRLGGFVGELSHIIARALPMEKLAAASNIANATAL